MRVLHCCLSCFYIDDFGYQENILPELNYEDGHAVKILASILSYTGSKESLTQPSSYSTKTGIPVVRVGYNRKFPPLFAQKFGIYKDKEVYNEIDEFNPDVIFFHGTGGFSLRTIIKYKKKNPSVKVYADNHSFNENTAQSRISRLAYTLFLNPFLRKNVKYLERIYYISLSAGSFLRDFKRIPEDKMEFMPLGGIIPNDDEYSKIRSEYRVKSNVSDDEILFVHSGKMTVLKKTKELLHAFSLITNSKFRLLLLGSFAEDTEEEIRHYINNDERIRYLGWQSQEDLRGYLCACDMYLQPGSESATLQNALCCRCPVMIFPSESHKLYLNNNGYFVKNTSEMQDSFQRISDDFNLLNEFSTNSLKIASEQLDYREMAKRYTI